MKPGRTLLELGLSVVPTPNSWRVCLAAAGEVIRRSTAQMLFSKFLFGAFSSMIHLCTRMMPVGNPAPSNHYTYFSPPGWTQHSYWFAARYMEQNVWDKFEGAVTGSQGIINAKNESNGLLGDLKITDDWRKVLAGEADIAVITDDCVELMKKMPEESVDYIFTDPPYDASHSVGRAFLSLERMVESGLSVHGKHPDARNSSQRPAEEIV